MCGIAFLASPGIETAEVETRLNLALRSLAHRGPDDTRASIFASAGIGATRLAIRDVEAGHQPVFSPDGRFSCVLNGEIFRLTQIRNELSARGHHFASRGDTEVVLASFLEWGCDLTSHLDGMYAILIYDSVAKITYGFRDAAGIKPLYYSWQRGVFALASEIKAIAPLMDRELKPDRDLFDEFLVFGYIAGQGTLICGVNEVPPGSYVVASTESLRVIRYWSPFKLRLELGEDWTDFESAVAVVEQEVPLWAESDQPLGLMASGGIDSTLVGALTNLQIPIRNAYYLSHLASPDPDEEASFCDCMGHIGCNPWIISASDSDMLDSLEIAVRHFDEPIIDFNVVSLALLNSHIAQQESLKVILCGEGADEVLGGYDRHVKLSRALASSESDVPILYGTNTVALPRLYRLVDDIHLPMTGRREIAANLQAPTALGKILEFDQMTYLTCRLNCQDHAGMLYSHEIRPPLLSGRILSTLNALPDHFKIREGFGKWFLRKLHARHLPSSVSWRPIKRPLPADAGRLFRGGALAELLLSVSGDSPNGSIAGRYSRAGIRHLIDLHERGEDQQNTLWRLLALGLWLERFH